MNIFFQQALLWIFLLGTFPIQGKTVDLAAGKPIHFDKIARNTFTFHQKTDELSVAVRQSSSLWILPFKKKRNIDEVRVHFRLPAKNLEQNTDKALSQKSHDDWPLRVGLMRYGDPPWIPFLAPSWIKAVKEILHLPSNFLLNLTPSKKFLGKKWQSPYTSSIVHKGVDYQSNGSSHRLQYKLSTQDNPLVGLWVHCDGDDLKRNFTLILEKIELIDHGKSTL